MVFGGLSWQRGDGGGGATKPAPPVLWGVEDCCRSEMPSEGDSLGRRRGSRSGWEGSAASRRCPGSKCETPRSESWSLEGREKGLATFSTVQVSQWNQRQCGFWQWDRQIEELENAVVAIFHPGWVWSLDTWRLFNLLNVSRTLRNLKLHTRENPYLDRYKRYFARWMPCRMLSPKQLQPKYVQTNNCLQLGFYVGWSCVLTLMERARYIFIYSSHYHAHKSIHIFMTRYLVLKLTNATSLCGIDLSSRDDIRWCIMINDHL